MDYFELFGLPYNLKIEKAYNLKKYYELSRKYHPDQYSLKDLDAQQMALSMTALVNEAKKVLDNENLRLEYLLKLKGYLEEDEKYSLPQDFLMSMMELNEAIMENKMEEDNSKREALDNEIRNLNRDIKEDVEEYLNQDNLILNEEIASKLKAYYFKCKYLERMKSNAD